MDKSTHKIISTFLNNILSKKRKENESENEKKYLCHYGILADVFNAQNPRNSVTVFVAIVACLLDLVN